MKKIYIVLQLFLFSFAFCGAQTVTIPDNNFVAWLKSNGFDSCMNGNQLDTTCPEVLSATTINCPGQGISNLTGVQYFKALTTLTCYANNLTFLPHLVPSIINLDCADNQITSLPPLPDSLINLTCDHNLLTGLPPLPPNIQNLFTSNNQLDSLPILPAALNQLDCSYNNLTSIPVFPAILLGIECNNNQLTSLPSPLPYQIGNITCSYNQITTLPTLPPNLVSLDCSYNLLSILPSLTTSALRVLNCSNNLLTVLPDLPTGFTDLTCSDNQLTGLPALPNTLNTLVIDSNPGIDCLPPIQSVNTSLDISGTNIHCLPDRIQYPDSLPMIDTLPLCGTYNPNGCDIAWGIQGNVSLDLDENCNTTTDETALSGIKLELLDNDTIVQQVYTNVLGNYSFGVHSGNYIVRVDTTGLPFYVLCPDSNIHHSNLIQGDSLDYSSNFRLACKPGYDLAVNSISYSGGSFFPGYNSNVIIQAGLNSLNYKINCADSVLQGTVQAIVKGPVTYNASTGAIPPSQIRGDTITWNITNFSIVNFSNSFGFILSTNINAQTGDSVCISVTITGSTGADNNPSNNLLAQCFTVVNSHDPNFKEVYPAATSLPNEWLTYTIHFQNTGTASAQNIYVLDTIDNNLNLSTIQVVGESNNAFIQVLPDRIVRFNFPNVNLPDSTSSPESSIGHVQFKIKTDNSIQNSTIINNIASVYFDYNAPVQTNAATSVYVINVSTGAGKLNRGAVQLKVYPNPTGGEVNIVLSGEVALGEGHCLISITDVLGRTIMQKTLPSTNSILDLSPFASGVYFLQISTPMETSKIKVVKD